MPSFFVAYSAIELHIPPKSLPILPELSRFFPLLFMPLIKYLPLIRPGGLCIYDTELVHPGRKVEAQFKGLPLWGAVRERLGSAVSYNVAVLGALVTLTGAVRIGSIEMVLAERFPAAHHEGNLRALHLGVELAEPLLD